MSKESIMYPIKKILLPTDGSKYSLHAAKYAAQIAKKHSSTVTLLHVIESLHLEADYPIKVHTLKSVTIQVNNEDEIKARAIEVMKTTREIFDELDVPVETEYYSYGNIHQIIIETAEKENINLIIMGHKGVTGLEHILLGSIAEGVCRGAPCPVLIVR